MEVKVKKLDPNSVIPTYAKEGDAGLDLTSISMEVDEHGNYIYHTGLAFEIPEGYVGLIFPRSSIYKQDIFLTNSVGVIDSGYRGEVCVKFKNIGNKDNHSRYTVGERVAQMIIIPYPKIEFKEVDELSETDRGQGGFGSTGK